MANTILLLVRPFPLLQHIVSEDQYHHPRSTETTNSAENTLALDTISDLPLLPAGLAPPSERRRRLVPGQQAIETLMMELNLSIPKNQHIGAFTRIQQAYATSHAHLNREFFAPVITDLDAVLFNGWLSDYTLINWESMTGTPCCLSGKPSAQPPYEKDPSGSSRLRVRLAVYPSSPREQTWGGILHEMLHAYLDLMSEWHGLKQPHGPLFSAACTAMVRRVALPGLKVHHVDGGAGG